MGLLALERSGGRMIAATDLQTLAAAEMKLVGRFTCRACKMYCDIDRFEVAGRRFPFGGRCSLLRKRVEEKSPHRAGARPGRTTGRDHFMVVGKHINTAPRDEPAESAIWGVGSGA